MKKSLLILLLLCGVRLLEGCGSGNHQTTATHFSFAIPSNATTGVGLSFTVTALDASNNTVTTYSGTVRFTSSDSQATLPAASMLTNGAGTFSATLKTSGAQTITATDTVTTSITGTSNSISVIGPATHFSVAVPSNVTTGVAFGVNVIALDASNNMTSRYAGTVHFTTSDAHASLPANSTLSNGTGTFSMTLKTIGSQTITATDTVTASIAGTSSSISVGTNAPTHFSVNVPGGASPGSAFNFAVSALDAANNLAPSYPGTIHFTSSDPSATLPANSTLTNGSGNFSGTLKTVGSQTITATDTVKASIAGTSNSINIAQLAIVGQPPNGTVGVPYGTTQLDCHSSFTFFELGASGGSGPFMWSGASLPPGLQVTLFTIKTPCNPLGVKVWVLQGDPTQAGTFRAVLTVTDSEVPAVQKRMTFTITISAAAAEKPAAVSSAGPRAMHHHYKVIDIGTFGGPSSYFNDLSLSDRFGFVGAFGFAPVLNPKGILAGWADTSAPDPYPAFCFSPDCFVSHAFAWHQGVKTDLGSVAEGWSSTATWINSSGLIVGYSQNGLSDPVVSFPELRAVIWKDGQITDLGTLGGSASYASAVNSSGKVVGTALNAVADPFSFYDVLFFGVPAGTQTRAFIWDEKDGMQDIGTLGGPDATAALINDRGQVAGFSYVDSTPVPSTGIPAFHPFLWDRKSGMKDLGTLGGTQLGSVNGLNEKGQVVGATTIAGDQQLHAFLWDGEKLIDLTQPPFGGDANGEADWINEAGEITGLGPIPAYCPADSFVGPIQHAFVWRQGQIVDLGTLPGTTNSEGDFINSRSQIVGLSWTCDFAFTAFLWENDSIVDLNTLISPNSALYLFAASFINDRGEIAAFGSLANGDQHALLLVPCDEEHPNVEDCDYSLVDNSADTSQEGHTTIAPAMLPSALPNADNRAMLMSRMGRFGPRP